MRKMSTVALRPSTANGDSASATLQHAKEASARKKKRIPLIETDFAEAAHVGQHEVDSRLQLLCVEHPVLVLVERGNGGNGGNRVMETGSVETGSGDKKEMNPLMALVCMGDKVL